LLAKESDLSAARADAQAQAQAAAAAAKSSGDETVARHLLFIDRLLADKAELSKQCEGMAAQLRGMEERHAAAEVKREEGFGREMKRQKEMWAAGEKARREQVRRGGRERGHREPIPKHLV
jgi:5-azacytidine-induced protein 1